MSIKEIAESHYFKIAAMVVGVMLIALISFFIGLAVGFHKARFSYSFGENYERNFAGPHGGPAGFLPDPMGPDFRNGHGVAGTIISINDNSIIIKDRDNKENTVTVTDQTLIKRFKEDVKVSGLKVDEKIIILGKPDENGTIKAEFIRVFDQNF